MNELRTVIDTGVAISAALLPRSIARQAFDCAAARGRLLVSSATIAELDDVFRRPKFNKYVPEEKRLEFLAALVHEAETIEITEAVRACRDRKDDMFLEIAVSGRATHILSGDQDLLVLHPFRGIAVVTPQEFLAAMHGSEAGNENQP
jgi:putative PIN family toxin of toxin-antitoxin system